MMENIIPLINLIFFIATEATLLFMLIRATVAMLRDKNKYGQRIIIEHYD